MVALGEPEIALAVLGPFTMRGAVRPFSRLAARDLVVYLAFHRHDVRNDVWASALWPECSVAPSTVHSTASVARRSLGQALDGSEHLPKSGRHLRLAASVGTDAEQVAAAAASNDPERWRRALELVRGPLFEGVTRSDWAVLDGTQAEVESMVVDLALKGAAHYLHRGAGDVAEEMIRRGLRASPYDERLYRALLWASEVKGDRIGLRSTMDEILARAAEREGVRDPGWRLLHPQTLALYRELAGGKIPAARRDLVRL
ncbi:MAG TPA: BTAD domain-containing putative transcriptional regulator [Acidimicrobiales bacterium]|nr:BTAD domain-containing putative transcriptional regulator [Acidimicrobiales bacterium]